MAGHAATITGLHVYDYMETKYRLPCAVAGFTPVDILSAIYEILELIRTGQAKVINCYGRVVNEYGNPTANRILSEVFNLVPGNWRGITAH